MALSPSVGVDQGDSEFDGPSSLDFLLLICAVLTTIGLGALAAQSELPGRWRLLFAAVSVIIGSVVLWFSMSWQKAYTRSQRQLLGRIKEWEQWHAESRTTPADSGANAGGGTQAAPPEAHAATQPPQTKAPPPAPPPPGLPGMPPGPDPPPGVPDLPAGPTPGFVQQPPPQHQGLNAFANWTHGNAPTSGPFSMPAYPPKPPPGVPQMPGWTDSSELGAKPDVLEQAQLNAAMAASSQSNQAETARIAAAAKHVR